MTLRIARHTDRLDEIVAFYRDRVGLPERGRFDDHDGYSGVFLDVLGTDAHLEFTSGGDHQAPDAHPESLLVLYFDDADELDRTAERLAGSQVTPANPYWVKNARAYADPDGFQIVLTLKHR